MQLFVSPPIADITLERRQIWIVVFLGVETDGNLSKEAQRRSKKNDSFD